MGGKSKKSKAKNKAEGKESRQKQEYIEPMNPRPEGPKQVKKTSVSQTRPSKDEILPSAWVRRHSTGFAQGNLQRPPVSAGVKKSMN